MYLIAHKYYYYAYGSNVTSTFSLFGDSNSTNATGIVLEVL